MVFPSVSITTSNCITVLLKLSLNFLHEFYVDETQFKYSQKLYTSFSCTD
jgi:hypothetical protein